ncbi:hypothetical protein [Nocardioides alkalitolerans]|uniref:hypothetical protein n=1 Tax=Nocardioides alkalitolerans TaxID=281714 RepID=UPI00040FEC56|nr:hypothetical protein [Nocardioides alkalitolerans]
MRTNNLTPALDAFRRGLPVKPVGYLPNGRAVYPIAGGAPDDGDGKGGDDNGDDGGKDKGGDNGGADNEDKFTPITSQADLDKVLGKRLERERGKFPDYDDLKKKAEQYDKHLEETATEQEKAVKAARQEGENAAVERTNTYLINAKAEVAAATAKFRNPATAVKLMDLSGVTVTNGVVDAAAVKAAAEKLAESDPYLVDTGDGKGRRPSPDKNQGGSDDKPSASVAAGRDAYAEQKARRNGGSTNSGSGSSNNS